MLFRQRRQPNLRERFRLYLWPRRSFSRSVRYSVKRLLRIPARPHNMALGLAVGVFFAATPLYGLHILCAVFVAWALSANIAAAVFGTVLANPLTIPFLFSAAYEAGRWLLPMQHKAVSVPVLWEQLQKLNFSSLSGALFQISVGSALIGAVLAAFAYWGTYKAVKSFQEERRKCLYARRLSKSGSETAPRCGRRGRDNAAHRNGAAGKLNVAAHKDSAFADEIKIIGKEMGKGLGRGIVGRPKIRGKYAS